MRGRLPAMALVAAATMAVTAAPAATPAGKSPIVDDVYHAITTVRDMYSMAVALEAYYRDNRRFPAVTTTEELKKFLQPDYAAVIETADAWGTSIRYLPTPDGQDYRLVSAGSDRTFDESTWGTPGVFTDSKEDAVFERRFVRKWSIDIP